MAASSNLGFVAGPALAGLLGAMGLGELPPIIAACAISGLAILIIGLGLPETTPGALSADPAQVNVRKVLGQQHKECFTMPAARKLTIAEILALPSMNLMLAVYFLVFLGFNLFYVAFPVYATTTIGWSLTQIGVYCRHGLDDGACPRSGAETTVAAVVGSKPDGRREHSAGRQLFVLYCDT